MIRKNVASQTVYLPQLRLTADGSAVTTGASLVVAKDGVEAAAAGTLAHYAGGIWKYTPTQGETNCAIMALVLTATGADTVLLNILTTAANPQDATAFGIGNLDAAITSRMATYTQPTGFLAATFPGTVASPTNITAGTITTVTNLTNAATSGDLTATMKASVNTEIDAALADIHLDHLLAVTYDPASKPGVSDALLNELVENDGGVARYTANALEQAPSGGGGVADWTSDERTAIRSILGIPGSGTTPSDPTTGILDTIRDKTDTLTTYVDTEVAAIKAKTDNLPANPAAVGDAMTLTAAYDAAKTASTQTSVNTLATYVDTEVAAIKAKTDNLPVDPADASDIAASFATVNSTLATIAGYIDTEVAAIKAKTDNLPIDPADASDIAASFASLTSLVNTLTGYVDTEVAAIKAKTDNLPANPAAVSDIPTANQNRDALLNALPSAGYVDGSFGDRWLISSGNQRTVAVTGSNHIAADIHDLQAGVITAGKFAAGAINANALAADAAAEIAAAVAEEPLAGHTTAGTLGKVLSDAGSGISTLLGRITSTVYTMFTDLVQMIVNDGTASAQWSSTAMQNVPVAGGSGARSVTITVRDSSSNPIQNASVRVYRTGESFILSTNASGVAAFSLDDATWTVAITATGFSFTPASLVISANTSQTYTMTTAGGGVTPSEPPFCTGFWTVYNQNGTVQAAAQVSIQASSPPVGSTGIVMEDAVRTATADNNGVVQFSNLIKGATYIVYRTGSSRKFTITVPTNAGNTQALGSIVG